MSAILNSVGNCSFEIELFIQSIKGVHISSAKTRNTLIFVFLQHAFIHL